jgi:hypothetical protein
MSAGRMSKTSVLTVLVMRAHILTVTSLALSQTLLKVYAVSVIILWRHTALVLIINCFATGAVRTSAKV